MTEEPTFLDHDDVHQIVVDAVKSHPRGQNAFATDVGISKQYLSAIMHRRVDISENAAAKLGFAKLTVFVRLNEVAS